MTATQLPEFALFPDPVGESVILPHAEPCCLCGQKRGWLYVGPTYGADVPEGGHVCPWCIADGTAKLRGIAFNDATIYPYRAGTQQMSDADRELVEERTPGFTTWQGNHWLMCCDRACKYLGEATAEDLKGRWSDAVPKLFAGDTGWSDAEMREVVGRVCRGGQTCAYMFQCEKCREVTGYWDCD